jgi:hypothetical protein
MIFFGISSAGAETNAGKSVSQAFFDKNGDEVFRHQGFYPENEIHNKLADLKML